MITDTDVLMSVAAPVFAIGATERIVGWNQGMETVTGIRTGAAIGRSAAAVLGAEAAEILKSNLGSGARRVPNLGAVSVKVQDGFVVGLVNDHEREAYLGMAAHDLRAPLRNILFLADEALRDASNANAMLARIKQVARQGTALADDVLSCVQASGVSAGAFSKVELSGVAKVIFTTLNVADRHSLSAQSVTLMSEKPVVQIVLRNLLDNAIRHGAGRRLHIEISAQTADEGVAISVADNGPGFPESARRFLAGGEFRVESGYGLLGLRRLIRARGGVVNAMTREGGKGSLVRVTLPGCILHQSRNAA